MKILVIDDEKNVRRILRDYLQNEGFEVIEGIDGEDGIRQVMAHHKALDLILLDVRMPNLSGFEAVTAIRDLTEAPVIFLTALDGSYDEIKGLELGGDDYITKPFNYKVLMARVKACLRKNGRFKETSTVIGAMTLDDTRKVVSVNGKNCGLAQREYELLVYLYENRSISLDRLKILERIWGYDYEGDPRTVDTHIKTLRAKLGQCGSMIQTVRGVGYRFEADEPEWS